MTTMKIIFSRRKFRSQTSDDKQRWEEPEKRREEKKKEKESEEDPGARKGRKVAKHCVFPMISGSGGAADAEPAGQMRDEKLQAIVAQSTCPSHNVQNTPGLEHF